MVVGGVARARAHSLPFPLVLLLQLVSLPVVPPLHPPPFCLLLCTKGFIVTLFSVRKLLELVSGETPPSAQTVKACIQCCLHAAMNIADLLLGGTQPLHEACPLLSLRGVE